MLRLYNVKFELLSMIDDKECQFIEDYVYRTEDSLYYLEEGSREYSIEHSLKKAIENHEIELEEIEELLNLLKTAIKENDGMLNLTIA